MFFWKMKILKKIKISKISMFADCFELHTLPSGPQCPAGLLLVIFDVLESSGSVLLIFELFLESGWNPLDEPVKLVGLSFYVEIFVIFRSRQLHTPSSIPKPLAIPTNLIWDTIGGDSDQYTMIIAWFSVLWLSVLNGQNLEGHFGRIAQWNEAYTRTNTIRIHSWYLRTRLDKFGDVGCPGLVLFDYNDSVRMKRTDRNWKIEPPEYRL